MENRRCDPFWESRKMKKKNPNDVFATSPMQCVFPLRVDVEVMPTYFSIVICSIAST